MAQDTGLSVGQVSRVTNSQLFLAMVDRARETRGEILTHLQRLLDQPDREEMARRIYRALLWSWGEIPGPREG